MNKSVRLASVLFLVLVVFSQVLLAFHPAWRYHLRVDIDGQYTQHVRHFLTDGNLANLGYNEYQPGAVLFFILLSPSLLIENSNDIYIFALFLANIILILILAFLYFKQTGTWGIIIFSLLLFFTGPLLLYRFELLVGLFVVLSIILWMKKKTSLALIFLGIATMTKIYPALLLPYFLILLLKQQGVSKAFKGMMSFILGVGIILILYLGVFKATLTNLDQSYSIHGKKPVHVESVWGTALTIYSKITTGDYARGRGDVGIYGIAPEATIGPLSFYNYFWIGVMGFIYLLLLVKVKSTSIFNVTIPLLLLLVFLIFSKILTPQYILWFALIVPLTKPNLEDQNRWITRTCMLFTILFLSQYIYPLTYNVLLGNFYASGGQSHVFWLLAARNILLVLLFMSYTRELVQK